MAGKVRQLRNDLARALALAKTSKLNAEDLPLFEPTRVADDEEGSAMTLKAMAIELIRETLQRCKMNKSKAARELGISLSSLKDRIKRFGLD